MIRCHSNAFTTNEIPFWSTSKIHSFLKFPRTFFRSKNIHFPQTAAAGKTMKHTWRHRINFKLLAFAIISAKKFIYFYYLIWLQDCPVARLFRIFFFLFRWPAADCDWCAGCAPQRSPIRSIKKPKGGRGCERKAIEKRRRRGRQKSSTLKKWWGNASNNNKATNKGEAMKWKCLSSCFTFLLIFLSKYSPFSNPGGLVFFALQYSPPPACDSFKH